MVHLFLLLWKESLPVSHLESSGVFLECLYQFNNRTDSEQFLTLAPTRGWSHYTSVFFLCHLIVAAGFACLQAWGWVNLGHSHVAYGLMWQNIFPKMLCSPFRSLASLSAAVSTSSWELIKILKLLFLQSVSCDLKLTMPWLFHPNDKRADETPVLRAKIAAWPSWERSLCIGVSGNTYHILMIIVTLCSVPAVVRWEPPLAKHLT